MFRATLLPMVTGHVARRQNSVKDRPMMRQIGILVEGRASGGGLVEVSSEMSSQARPSRAPSGPGGGVPIGRMYRLDLEMPRLAERRS